MKRITALILSVLLLIGTATMFASCGGEEKEEAAYTRMTVDINPSVEFMVDEENKVVSVTALNDDGAILIAGEAFVGKTPEEAVELVVSLANDTGYLVKGNVEASENTVKISVSGDGKSADEVREAVEEKVTKFLTDHDIPGKVERVKAKTLAELRALVVADGLYTEEDAAAMDEPALYRALAAGRIETALLLTEDMRSAYYQARDTKISFTEREETAKVIEGMGAAYSVMRMTYSAALNAYSSAIERLDEMRYELLISPESDYQKSLEKLRESKEELLRGKSFVASLDVNGEEYATAQAELKLSEENYEKALAAYEALGKQADQALSSLVAVLRSGEEALLNLEASFPEEITKALQDKAGEIENAVNDAKDKFFTEFESAHKDDIDSLTQSLIDRKEALIAANKGEAE